MGFEAWQLAAMDAYGYMEDTDGPIWRVARYLAQGPGRTVEEDEFREACLACGVDFYDFTQLDITKLNHILERIT